MQKHVTVVGSVQIGFSVLGLMGAVAIFVALTFARDLLNMTMCTNSSGVFINQPSCACRLSVHSRIGWRNRSPGL